jgi:carbonic anhydrase/acetyltransferase-like protein (isoleucine patch superfamily)
MPVIRPYRDKHPVIDPSAFIAENAVIAGDVVIGPDSNIWYNVAMRGDVNNIVIGARTNIQDGTVIHVSSFGHNTVIGDDVTVGHMALLHACRVGDGGFVGMQACVMDGAAVEEQAMLAAGSLLTPGKVVPARQLWGGRPARFMRELTADDLKHMEWSAAHYVKLAREYRK